LRHRENHQDEQDSFHDFPFGSSSAGNSTRADVLPFSCHSGRIIHVASLIPQSRRSGRPKYQNIKVGEVWFATTDFAAAQREASTDQFATAVLRWLKWFQDLLGRSKG
jgi:hypothetical protein